jgi:hypothetical protein
MNKHIITILILVSMAIVVTAILSLDLRVTVKPQAFPTATAIATTVQSNGDLYVTGSTPVVHGATPSDREPNSLGGNGIQVYASGRGDIIFNSPNIGNMHDMNWAITFYNGGYQYGATNFVIYIW